MQNQTPSPESNLYAPPAAVLEVASTQEFYVVSLRKFWIMSIATAGMYFLYWGFRHYQTIRAKTQVELWPIARAIFMLFFYHDLYRRFATQALSRSSSFRFNHAQYATASVVVVLVNTVCGQLSSRAIGIPLTSLLPLILIIAQAYLMAAAQSVANFACDDENGSANADFTALNVLWMVLGAVVWGFAIFGIYVTVFSPELLRSVSNGG